MSGGAWRSGARRRRVFPPSPLPTLLPIGSAHPLPVLGAFLLLSLGVGLAWTPRQLLPAIAGVLLLLLLPAPGGAAWRALARFAPLLVLVPLLHGLAWRGFAAGPLPWRFDVGGLERGLLAALRLGLWILVSMRTLERLHPAALLARLPASPRLARLWLAPLLALSWLELAYREAFLLERAWRARGGGGGRGPVAAQWPALLLPLFRNLLARGDALADSLTLRRFPERWAGSPRPAPAPGELLPLLAAAAAFAAVLWLRQEGGG